MNPRWRRPVSIASVRPQGAGAATQCALILVTLTWAMVWSAAWVMAGTMAGPMAGPMAGEIAAEPPLLAHRAEVVFDTAAHTVRITDEVLVPGGLGHLRLGADFQVTGLAIAGQAVADLAAVLSQHTDEDGDYQQMDLAAAGLTDGGTLQLVYDGTFFESTDDVVFSRENVGGEITATISQEGIYLSGAAEWLVWHEEAMAMFDIRIDTPAGFETVTQGTRTEHAAAGDRLLTRWVADYPSDGLNLIANRYHVHAEPVREGVTSYTFLLEDDQRLRETYMERTKAYITMYEEMIGPYPYTKFATVENWFPTGYGMPSYTLLGGQVLRLPFIPYTSFGHEICHNWWGNSVFVDTAEGNWCEGLTVYCADYHYKELESPDAAREYRRTLLKDYAAYTRDRQQDFPLSEFLSRHSGATRAVGYGKSMMVFHMVDRLIGRENFLAGLRDVARDHRFRRASWSTFFDAFAAQGDRDLAPVQEQWLTRTGAPILTLDDVEFDEDRVRFRLQQGAPPYTLEIPVVVSGADGATEHVVVLDKTLDHFEIPVQRSQRVSIDPDYHLFRRLDPQEIEPTLSQVLAVEMPVVVLDGATAEMTAAARTFAEDFTEMEMPPVVENGQLPADIPPGAPHANVVINPGAELAARYTHPGLVVSGKTLFLEGKRYSLDDYDLVYCAANPFDRRLTDLVIHSASPRRVQALARRLGHYGKYSWLLLPTGQGRVLRGNWQPPGSPLTAEKSGA